MNYQVLLYYHYTKIEDPAAFSAMHLEMCKEIGLKGRILVANEGINGTVSGTIEQTEQYMANMQADPFNVKEPSLTFSINVCHTCVGELKIKRSIHSNRESSSHPPKNSSKIIS